MIQIELLGGEMYLLKRGQLDECSGLMIDPGYEQQADDEAYWHAEQEVS